MNTLPERIASIKKECEEIIELAEKATKGPWTTSVCKDGMYLDRCLVQSKQGEVVGPRQLGYSHVPISQSEPNATFIAQSRNITPKMARVLKKKIEYLEKFQNTYADLISTIEVVNFLLTKLCDQWEESK